MELRTRDQRQRRFNGEAVGVGEPRRVILECGALACALLIIAQRGDRARLVTDTDADRSLQSALGALGVLIRCGIRSASSIKP